MSMPVATGLTRADLDELPDDGHRYEIIDGRLFVSPLARVRHQRVVAQIVHRLMQWTDEHGGSVYPGVNVDLADDTHLEPDVVYAVNEDTSGLALEFAPELVVEISSPSTKRFDAGAKKDRYAAEGAREFWVVDLDRDEISRFTLRPRGGYGPAAVHRRGETFAVGVLDGLVLDVDDLLGPAEH